MYIDESRLEKVISVVCLMPVEGFILVCIIGTLALIARAIRHSSPLVIRSSETSSIRIKIPTYARKRYVQLWGERGSPRWSVASWFHALADSIVLSTFFLLTCMPITLFFWIVQPRLFCLLAFTALIATILVSRFYRVVAVSKALRRGNYVRARYITESAWLKKPKGNGKLYALVLMHSGEFEDAERVLEEELLQLNFNASPFPTHRAYIAADLLALLARISLRRKRVDRALYLYRSAVGLCPTHPLALTGLSEVYLSSGKSIERAIRMLNTAKVLTCVQLFERFLLPHRRVRVLGALAWANALAGNFSKADALLLSGLNNSSRIISAEKALLFARAAFVRALEQRYLEAGAYLSIASEYDSFGYVGGKARLRLSRESLLFPLR